MQSSEQGVGDRLAAALDGEADPARRARLLVEWNMPLSQVQRSEWMLGSEFERASLRVSGISQLVAEQYGHWRAITAGVYRSIDPGMAADAAALLADRLLGLADGLSWQLMLGNASEAHVRAILCDSVAADLALRRDDLLAESTGLDDRIAVIRGEIRS